MAKMRKKSDLPEKPCQACGRPMVWRKSWAKTWDEVRYCSERCRRNRPTDAKLALRP
ncbi:DUF2256 domain-containing protein [Rhizobium sp. EC-SD404]|uniref:DUF2256 domain-containing protein n=1 Tax=Rhizobium sp. EC-SD404 TaxID=2038389 RepID=UPI00125EDCFC|nr:DUF2256 domain-containing protein [Rhizobium sp. EC-SD404]